MAALRGAREQCRCAALPLAAIRAPGQWQAARTTAGIEDVTISIPLGETLVPVPEGNRYLGFIFAAGDTPDATPVTDDAGPSLTDL